MATAKYTTLGQGTLSTSYSNSDTSLVLDSGQGATFPASGDFWIRIHTEILKVTARSSDTLTVTRAQDGTSAVSLSSGADVIEVVTANMLDQLRADICQSGTQASLPASEKAGILYLPTTGVHIYRDNGSTMQAWGPIMPCTRPPAASNFTAVNQGSSTLTDNNGMITLYCPNAAGTNLRIYKQSQSAANFTLEAAFLSNMPAGTNARSGIFVTDGTKYMTVGPSSDNSRSVDLWNTATSFSSGGSALGSQNTQRNQLSVWRIVYTHSGTTFSFQYSPDGGNTWLVLTTNNSFLGTVSGLGIFVDSESAGQDIYLSCFHYKVS